MEESPRTVDLRMLDAISQDEESSGEFVFLAPESAVEEETCELVDWEQHASGQARRVVCSLP